MNGGLKNMRSFVLAAAAGLALSFSVVGCGAEEEIDCFKICKHYDDCVDSSYDVSACQDRCEDDSDNVAGYEAKADACESCIDGDTSCVEAGFQCSDECAGIIP